MQRQTFISYCHDNMKLVEILEAALHARGVRTWRDIHDMKGNDMMENVVRGLIRDEETIDSYILVATPESLQSDPVIKWELTEALSRRKYNEDFGVFVLLDGVGFGDLSKATSGMGLNLSMMKQVKIPDRCPNKDLPKYVSEAASGILEWKVDQMMQMDQFADDKIVINQHTRGEYLFDQKAHFEINLFRSYFKEGGAFSDQDWDHIITAGFQDLKRLLAQKLGTRHQIEVQAKGSLSAAVALGYVFRKTSGFHMMMTQQPGSDPWVTNCEQSGNRLLKNTPFPDDVSSKDVIVELGISNKTDQLVEKYMRDHNMKIRAREILFIPNQSGRSVGGTQDAIDIADQLAVRLKELHNQYGPDTVFHLFYSGPIALAIIIGHSLNACGKIRLYDLPSDKSAYYPTALLA